MSKVLCPTCNKPFEPAESQAMPFCSNRCRQIDLGRWLREETGVPALSDDEGEDGPPPRAPADDN